MTRRRLPLRALLAMLLAALAIGSVGVASAAAAAPGQGPGGPVLVIANPGDPFGHYDAEILTAEGLDEFAVADLGGVTGQTLSNYRVAVLAQTSLTDAQSAMLTTWVQNGGQLIAMRPDPKLAGVLGLGSHSGTPLSDGYVKVSGVGPGSGITTDTMQFHGAADRWTTAGASPLATLYATATGATANPAVTLHNFGAGSAAAFTYDLARSVVWTRQGNPAWARQERDHVLDDNIRSDDLFFGGAEPDWVDLSKVAIPQADEQQRLLANLVTQMSADSLPLPRFWYFPRGERAVVVLTGDDHGNGGTKGQFDRYDQESPANCSVADWECIRSTSYVYPGTPITNGQAAAYEAKGFEIGLHLTTGCSNFTRASLRDAWDGQLPDFKSDWPGLPSPVTNRTHCIVWSDWASEPIVEHENGVRLDNNYYYWPGSWVENRPGMFTGSGIPMRFADTDGSLIDVYQATTQMTDESDIDVGAHIKALLDGALGANGYYGAFTANMHTDADDNPGADAIVAEATARGVPVVSARQLLTWVDGRNDSSFGGLSFSGNRLSFTVQVGAGARGLEAMVPTDGPTGAFTSLTHDGAPVATTLRTVKGVDYRVFDAAPGAYSATYGSAPAVNTSITGATVTGNGARFSFTADQPGATFECGLDAAAFAPCASPKDYASLAPGTHTLRVRATVDGVADPTPAERAVTIAASGGGSPGSGSGAGAGSGAPAPGPGAPAAGSEAGAPGAASAGTDRQAPRVKPSPRSVRASSSGIVRLRVTCPRGERRCRVRLRLRLHGRYVASKTLTVAGGRTRVFTLKLSRAAHRELARKRALTVTAVAFARDAAGNGATTKTSIRLRSPTRR
jgi:hypothetical protein